MPMLRHLALVMDGNRRWARSKGLLSWKGHEQGVEAAGRAIDFCLKKGIRYLSLYTFSIENFRRAPQELTFLFELMTLEAERGLDRLIEKGVRIRFIGDRSLFPAQLLPTIDKVEKATQHMQVLDLTLLFCYGAQQEIVSGIKQFISRMKEGSIREAELSEESFKQFLWTKGIPEPDIIVRTGGKKRLSNFLLYQAAYSELFFLDCLWPDLDASHLEKAVLYLQDEQRNFGV